MISFLRTMHYNVRPTGERDRVCTCLWPNPSLLLFVFSRIHTKPSAYVLAQMSAWLLPTCFQRRTGRSGPNCLRPTEERFVLFPPKLLKLSFFTDSSSLFFFFLFFLKTHVPFAAIYSRPHEAQIRVETGLPCPHDTGVPKNSRKETDQVLKLAGLQAY